MVEWRVEWRELEALLSSTLSPFLTLYIILVIIGREIGKSLAPLPNDSSSSILHSAQRVPKGGRIRKKESCRPVPCSWTCNPVDGDGVQEQETNRQQEAGSLFLQHYHPTGTLWVYGYVGKRETYESCRLVPGGCPSSIPIYTTYIY